MDSDALIENSNIDFVIFRVAYALYVLWAGLESTATREHVKGRRITPRPSQPALTLLNDAVSYSVLILACENCGVLETCNVSALSVTETIPY
jgi:hypothetical protein